jgi:hypothetical protein
MVRLLVAVAIWLAVPWDAAVLEAEVQGSPARRLSPGRISMGGNDWRSKLGDAARLAAAASAATIIAKKLAKIEAEFRERRQRLTVVSAGTESEAYRAKEVSSLVDSTEEDVLDALDDKEWAALRDSVSLRFRRVRTGLESSAQTASAARPGIRLAAFGRNKADREDLMLRTRANPLIEAVGSLIATVKSRFAEKRLTVRLCVISQPVPEATFHMWPPSYKKGDFGGDTVKEIPGAPIGRYFYKAQYRQRGLKKQYEPIECGGEDNPCFDFVENTADRLIECDFVAGICRDRELSGKCPPQ